MTDKTDKIAELKILSSTNEEKVEWFKTNNPFFEPNEFLIKLALEACTPPHDEHVKKAIKYYRKITKKELNNETYHEYKHIEKLLEIAVASGYIPVKQKNDDPTPPFIPQ